MIKMTEFASPSDTTAKTGGSKSGSSEGTATGASESALFKDAASWEEGGGCIVSSIVTHKITLQAYTSNCSQVGGGVVAVIAISVILEGKPARGGVTLCKRRCYTARLVPLGCAAFAEHALCLCSAACHITGGLGAALGPRRPPRRWRTERCEALLSRVVHLMALHPQNCTFGHVHDFFMLFPFAGRSPKGLQNVNVPKGLSQLVERNFKRLMPRFDVGVMPPFFWSIQKTSVVLAEWDLATMDFPCSLDTLLPAKHYSDLCTKTLHTLAKPVSVDPQVMTELRRHVHGAFSTLGPPTPPPHRWGGLIRFRTMAALASSMRLRHIGAGPSFGLRPPTPPPHRCGGLRRLGTTHIPAALLRGLLSPGDHRGRHMGMMAFSAEQALRPLLCWLGGILRFGLIRAPVVLAWWPPSLRDHQGPRRIGAGLNRFGTTEAPAALVRGLPSIL